MRRCESLCIMIAYSTWALLILLGLVFEMDKSSSICRLPSPSFSKSSMKVEPLVFYHPVWHSLSLVLMLTLLLEGSAAGA